MVIHFFTFGPPKIELNICTCHPHFILILKLYVTKLTNNMCWPTTFTRRCKIQKCVLKLSDITVEFHCFCVSLHRDGAVFECKMCSVQVTCNEQLQSHLNGAKHKGKLRSLEKAADTNRGRWGVRGRGRGRGRGGNGEGRVLFDLIFIFRYLYFFQYL